MTTSPDKPWPMRIASALGLLIVFIGLVHTMPTLPGLDEWVRALANDPTVTIRKFPYEYLNPLAFVLMMTVVVFSQSFYRAFKHKGSLIAAASLAMDVLFIVMAYAVAWTYLVEIESVCIIDQITGERQELIARALAAEREYATALGLPPPQTIDDPNCINTTGLWLFAIMGVGILTFLVYNIKVWGFPLVAISLLIALYTLGTVAIWYFYGADGISKYWITKLGGEPRQLVDGLPNVRDILVNSGQGILGRFMSILMGTVFPYIVLGNLFGVSAGGQSLIKLAFLWTRRLRGGPAHAAIISSAMFGTISGGPVVNVLSTGVLTIPMMLKRGFTRAFAGGIEAAASSGGQIMPPVMGVAAFVLSAVTAVAYSSVIVAAIIPAIAYFGALFLSVVFQARKQNIQAVGEATDDMRLTREDKIHLLMIFGPILVILLLLLTPKEAVSCGLIGSLFAYDQQFANGACVSATLPWPVALIEAAAGDASSAGWWASALLAVLFFMDKSIRANPGRIVRALADAGVVISTLYLMFLAVSVIDFSLNFTGLASYIANDIVHWMRETAQSMGGSGLFVFTALLSCMLLAILLGMGMPTVPAYLNVALLMGPLLVGLGIAEFTAHMFVFYFAVASAITPPVAIAAFAAASITKEDPMITGLSAVRSGVVMFVIPFVFAFYPELLLIPEAQLDPTGSGHKYLPGYDGSVHWLALAWVCARVALGLYLLASVLSRFDRRALSIGEMVLRIALAVGVLWKLPMVYWPAILASFALLFWHATKARAASMTPRPREQVAGSA
ncbi:MAG: TRAP transporter fused permease subunit [Burkholderiaceae bacterium]